MRRVLLVEDSENDIELTLLALQKAGLKNPIDVVRDGVQALYYLCCENDWQHRDAGLPAVILLDKKLPRLDGHEVLAKLRSDSNLRHIPVVMLTSSRQETDLLKSYDLGVNAYVVKPVEFADFMAAIRDVGTFWLVLNEEVPVSNGTGKALHAAQGD
jgi:CheY-like chemotaxis protein